MSYNIQEITKEVTKGAEFLEKILSQMRKVIVGQEYMINRLIIGLIANGHILLEGVPGLAKTLAIRTLAQSIKAQFSRIQFTPDLLPADLIGTLIYNQKTGEFTTKKGPIFANIVLADEINRAPAKVQSALLEAMQERQVTIGENTYSLPEPFLVLATQNPIEQEGTYPLPEAQVDRFLMKLKITYPSREEELLIQERMATTSVKYNIEPVITPEDILKIRQVVDMIYMDKKVCEYIVDIVMATRYPERYGLNIKQFIEYGASPRATIGLSLVAKAYAFLKGRAYVTPQDVKDIGMDVLRHRVIISYEAEAEEKTSEDIIQIIFDNVEVP